MIRALDSFDHDLMEIPFADPGSQIGRKDGKLREEPVPFCSRNPHEVVSDYHVQDTGSGKRFFQGIESFSVFLVVGGLKGASSRNFHVTNFAQSVETKPNQSRY